MCLTAKTESKYFDLDNVQKLYSYRFDLIVFNIFIGRHMEFVYQGVDFLRCYGGMGYMYIYVHIWHGIGNIYFSVFF